MNTLLIAVFSIVLSVAAQFSLKTGMSHPEIKSLLGQPFMPTTLLTILTNRFVAGGFLLYGLGAAVWLTVLARWDVSKAYPLAGLGFCMAALAGLLAGEQVGLWRLLGIMLICTGVVLVGRS